MPVYQSKPNFNFFYRMVGANSGLTFASGNIYMEHIMEYTWNIYNILVIQKRHKKRKAAALHTGADNPTVFILSNNKNGLHKFHLKRC